MDCLQPAHSYLLAHNFAINPQQDPFQWCNRIAYMVPSSTHNPSLKAASADLARCVASKHMLLKISLTALEQTDCQKSCG